VRIETPAASFPTATAALLQSKTEMGQQAQKVIPLRLDTEEGKMR